MTTVNKKYPACRMRRLRLNPAIRDMVRETHLSLNDLIFPMFVEEGATGPQPISTMPGITRYCESSLVDEIGACAALGIKAVALFPKIPDSKKDEQASHAIDPENIICRVMRKIKKLYPDLLLIGDVALDPYTSHGQDGIIDKEGYIINDITVEALVKQGLALAQAGADILGPSDMMDGRVGAIRKSLDEKGLIHTMILSYAAKYASHFYGPFRDAVGSSQTLKGKGKETYQMDFANAHDAIHEIAMDLEEGADLIMVKPGLPYLDIIKDASDRFKVPVFAYQVSGEYSMLKQAVTSGFITQEAIWESLVCFKRAGATGILSYFTKDFAQKLAQA